MRAPRRPGTLGAAASEADIDAMTAEIKNAKYSEIETLMTKDVAVSPSDSVLWLRLAQAELGSEELPGCGNEL